MGCSGSKQAGAVMDGTNAKDSDAVTTAGGGVKVNASAGTEDSSEASPSPSSSNRKKDMECDVSTSSSTSRSKRFPNGLTDSDTYEPAGYSSGASTPGDGLSLDGSAHSQGSAKRRPKSILHSSSIVGLDKMIEDRREGGDFKAKIVHIEVPFGKPIEEVYDGVHDGPVLGSGISGLVRLVTHKATGVNYAVKCLDLGLVETEEGVKQLREEIFIMCQLDHPNIVRLEEVYESQTEIYLVQELCLGGELFDRLDEQPDYHYTEKQCARLVKQMLCAVRYIHSKGIIHRDLKLENFLFSNTDPDSELKMIDFGLSKHFKFGEMQNEAVGTPYTVAPEVIRGCYDERCDVWAIGVITFLLLSGDPPFGGCGGPEPLMTVRSNILQGVFNFEPEDVWENVSRQAQDFIRKLLVTDPNGRPTAREAQKSTWLREWSRKGGKKEDNMLNDGVVKALVAFKEYSDMRKLLCEVLSFTLLPDQIQGLRREFEKMDTDGSGEISLEGLKHVLLENAEAGSLGALTEEEIEDIFNAMRVRKTETRIHWHEFIAAGLSQCNFDDRNLKLAFDRLDADHKGFITFDNVMDLLGDDEGQSEDAIRRMWGDSMKVCNTSHARITYEDFLLLMKGQTKEPEKDFLRVGQGRRESSSSTVRNLAPVPSLHVVPETQHADTGSALPSSAKDGSNVLVLPSGDIVHIDGTISNNKLSPEVESNSTLNSKSDAKIKDADDNSGPLTMDDDEEFDEMLSKMADSAVKLSQPDEENSGVFTMSQPILSNFTPPQSPKRGAIDYITPVSQRDKLTPETIRSLGQHPSIVRGRSKSVDETDTNNGKEYEEDGDEGIKMAHFVPDARRALALPVEGSEIDGIIKDETKTPLVVNRQIYRAHRQMRLAVLEASKRFEEKQLNRTKETIMAQKAAAAKKKYGAGLIMRHDHAKEMSSESLRKIMEQGRKQQQIQVREATKRGGRGRRTRKKTVSDMAGMLQSPPPPEEEISKSQVTKSQVTKPKLRSAKTEGKRPSTGEGSFSKSANALRKPTTPGVFRKTNDPFLEMTGRMHNSFGNIGVSPSSILVSNSGPRLNSIRSSGGSGMVSSMKSSMSDGKLNERVLDTPESSTGSPPTGGEPDPDRRIGASPSWPPPPPL